MLKTGLDQTDQLKHLQSSSPFDEEGFSVTTTLHECTAKLRASKAAVDQIVKDSFARRDTERAQKITELESSVLQADKASAQRLRRIRKAEDINHLFSKLRSLQNPGTRQGLTRIEIPIIPGTDPKTCVQWRQIDVPSEVLYHLQQRNKEHFGQAHGTPFTVPPLSIDLGFCDCTSSSMQRCGKLGQDVTALETPENATTLQGQPGCLCNQVHISNATLRSNPGSSLHALHPTPE